MAASHTHTCPKCEGYFVCEDDECHEHDLCIECQLADKHFAFVLDIHEVFALMTVLAQLMDEFEKDTETKPEDTDLIMMGYLKDVKDKLDKEVFKSWVDIKQKKPTD